MKIRVTLVDRAGKQTPLETELECPVLPQIGMELMLADGLSYKVIAVGFLQEVGTLVPVVKARQQAKYDMAKLLV